MLPLSEMKTTIKDCPRVQVLPVQNLQHLSSQQPSVSEDDEEGRPSSTEEKGTEHHDEQFDDYVVTLPPDDSPKRDLTWWNRNYRRNCRRRNDMFIRELLKDDLTGLTDMIKLTAKALAIVEHDMHIDSDDDDGVGSGDNDTDVIPDSDVETNDNNESDDCEQDGIDDGDDEIERTAGKNIPASPQVLHRQ
jgi:hypothetical protein